MSKSDADLMIEFRRTGRAAAFEELVRRYKVRLVNYFHRLTWDLHVAEDLSQEVFCRLFRYRDNYRPTASFATYLYRIGRNLWIDRYRSRRNAPHTVSLDAEVSDTDYAAGELIASNVYDPSQRMETSDEYGRVKAALDTLAPELRETLILVKYEGLKYAEAAAVLSVPVGTVRSRIHAAIQQLRSLLEVPAGKAGV
jgi:RNA polymerase sigma-70 factor (ECF subfamily)